MSSNKKLNIILIGIAAVLIIVLFNVFYIYKRNENSKIVFNEADFHNTTWVNDSSHLSFNDNKLIFKINDEEIINSNYKLNNRTGKFILDNDTEFYLRSINDYSIIVWHDKSEYNLEKEVIAR